MNRSRQASKQTMRRTLSTILSVLLVLSTFSGLGTPQGVHAAPQVGGLPSDPVLYMQGDGAQGIATIMTVTDETYNALFADGYLKFEIDGMAESERLTLKDGEFHTAQGEALSVEDGKIYLGSLNDPNRKQIGAVSTINDGEGKTLQIDFSTPLENGDFEETPTGNITDRTITGWTINTSSGAAYPYQIWLGDLASKTQGAPVSTTTNGPPYTVTGTVYVDGSSPSYSFSTDVYYNPTSHAAWGYEGMENKTSTTPTFVKGIVKEGTRGNVLEIGFKQGTVSQNLTNSSGKSSYGSMFGPEAVSEKFRAKQGDKIAFDWRAFTVPGDTSNYDDYEVYGFLVNEQDKHFEIMYGRGKNQDWITASNEIPADGEYRFRFVAGSYDNTGGTKLGATLRVDNVRVLSSAVTADVVQAVARQITYENTNVAETIEANLQQEQKHPIVDRVVNITTVNTDGQSNQTAQVTVRLIDELRLLKAEVQDTTPDLMKLTFNLPVGNNLNFTGLTVNGNPAITIKEVVSVEDEVVLVRLPSPIEAPFTVTYAEAVPSNVEFRENANNKLKSFGPDNGIYHIVPLQLIRVITDASDPTTVRLKFNKPIAKVGLDLTGMTIGGQPITPIAVDGDTLTVQLLNPYKNGDRVLYNPAAPSKVADAKHPTNTLGNIGANDHIPVIDGRLVDLGFQDKGGHPIPSQPFDKEKNDYLAVVPNKTDQIVISPANVLDETADTRTKVTLNGAIVPVNQLPNLPLVEGRNEIVVTIIDKVTGNEANSYTAVIWRTTNKLITLEASDNKGTLRGTLEPNFESGSHDYTLRVPYSVQEINITPTPSDPNATIEISVNEGAKVPVQSPADTSNLPLKVGKNTIVFTVTDQKGEQRIYTVTIYRADDDSSSSSPVAPPAPAKDKLVIDVVSGGKKPQDLVQVEIERTKGEDGQINDEVTFTPEKAAEAVEKAIKAGEDIARLLIPDPTDEVSRVEVIIPRKTQDILRERETDIEIETAHGTLHLPYAALAGVNKDLYFRVVPIRDQEARQEIETGIETAALVTQRANNGQIELLSRPLTIETNLSDREVRITLPLSGVQLPRDEAARHAFQNDLFIFVEHLDGTQELISAELVTMSNGELGLNFLADSLGTFTIVHLPQMQEHQRYINGYADGSFRPERSATRAEIAAMLVNIGAVERVAVLSSSFPDVEDKHWAVQAIAQVQAVGIMSGYPNGEFRPGGSLTRAEMAAILYNYLNLKKGEGLPLFIDVPAAHWASGVITAVNSQGIMSGYPDGTFQPDRELSRAEAVTILNRLFNKGPLYGLPESSWSDVSTDHWAYAAIEEASKHHAYTIHPQGGEWWISH